MRAVGALRARFVLMSGSLRWCRVMCECDDDDDVTDDVCATIVLGGCDDDISLDLSFPTMRVKLYA